MTSPADKIAAGLGEALTMAKLEARIAELEAENFALAAGACLCVTGDEGGNAYCSMKAENDRLRTRLEFAYAAKYEMNVLANEERHAKFIAIAERDAARAERDKAREDALREAAGVANGALGGYLCPFGRDKPGDPTWGLTDKDKCPVCGFDGEGSLLGCHDTVSGRIASAILALSQEPTP